MKAFQVYKFTDDIRDGRYLTANSDGSMRWTLTRGDAHKLSRKEADTMAAWVRKVFIGHMAIVVPEGKSPWEVLRAKPRGTKLNPKKRRTPAQRAATARMLAANKARLYKKGARAGQRAINKKRDAEYRKSWKARGFDARGNRRGENPVKPARGQFQIAARKGDKVLYLAGLGLSSNRATASNFGTISTARKIAIQLRDAGRKLGVGRVAVVTAHDSPGAIRSFLLGEA